MQASVQRQMMPGAQRQTMIDSQLRTVGVSDDIVLSAIAAVPRENFVPSRLKGLAYADAALEVGEQRWLLEPMVLALLLQNARVRAGDRVLVIGAATGYSAAVLTAVGAEVTALESDEALLAQARASGVTVVSGSLVAGWPGAAPYDVVLFEGAIESVPAAIAAQIAPVTGRAAAVMRSTGGGLGGGGSNIVGRAFAGIVLADGRIAGLPFLEVAAKPLPGFATAREFVF
ncbi:protein-L-isoaspartate O-methyltransferase [Polymorphobacter glacialis]|uniref:Protein-L-isoaspartate O-methyltransferase n=1 Tax=Sandarakinorhabdus glacialis TaxID=1614636 RepID=A0A916ZTK0_9SPHN|nr:protein-L-isoaspartate O-methyltransferase [Polymorphobacter glacialis]